MSRNERTCESLVDDCKQEAKHLVEFSATRRKLHWTHPSFTSFCVSVEDVLSYGVKRRYRSSKSKPLPPSAKVLHDLAKTHPEAATVYEKCFSSLQQTPGGSPNNSTRDDYTAFQTNSPLERKVLWIRVALIEKKLQSIIDGLMKNPREFYTEQSVLCHPVYGEIFCYLLDGPCSLLYSRVRTPDSMSISPSPAEIVQRHQRVLSVSIARTQTESPIATQKAWSHVHSLYQTLGATTLFGKNNILVQPAGFSEPLQGYLSLQLAVTSLFLKWIPNQLLNEPGNDMSSLWEHLMNVSIEKVAHIHCHRSPGGSAQMILIGYDGIAHSPIIFPHQPSFFHFLECLENGLLPQGSLEPPLWYLKTQTNKRSCKRSPTGSNGRVNGVMREGGEEWWETVGVWNQVFRVRFGGRRGEKALEDSHTLVRAPAPLPLNLMSYPLPVGGANGRPKGLSGRLDSSDSSEEEEEEEEEKEIGLSHKHGSLARKDWQRFQLKVSHQLLARYFYTWLSYCRHTRRVREKVAHMVKVVPTMAAYRPPLPPTPTGASALGWELWQDFLHCATEEKSDKWAEVLKMIYLKGVQPDLRKEVWPHLLGVYTVDSKQEEREAVGRRCQETYQGLLSEWKEVERRHKEVEERAIASISAVRLSFLQNLTQKNDDSSTMEEVQADRHSRSLSFSDSAGEELGTTGSTGNGSGKSRSSSPTLSVISDLSVGSPTSPHLESERMSLELGKSPGQTLEVSSESTRAESGGDGTASQPRLTVSGDIHGSVTNGIGAHKLQNGTHAAAEPPGGTLREGEELTEQPLATDHIRSSQQACAVTSVSHDLRVVQQRVGVVETPKRARLEIGPLELAFAEEMVKIDKDIPRCDRDYWYFKEPSNLEKLRNLISTYIWTHMDFGYSQGMCDILAPLLVTLDDEPLVYACYLRLMETAQELFPPSQGMNTKLANVQALLQVLEPDFFQYLSDKPMGDGLFYCYRWFLVYFKREFGYNDIFLLWETIWAARLFVSEHFEEFIALAILQQFKTAIMDAHLDASDILNLFTDLAEKRAIDGIVTIALAHQTVMDLRTKLVL